MATRYEYKFVRLGESYAGVTKAGRNKYQKEIEKYAREGWRLVQIFAPSTGSLGAPRYYELILEREAKD